MKLNHLYTNPLTGRVIRINNIRIRSFDKEIIVDYIIENPGNGPGAAKYRQITYCQEEFLVHQWYPLEVSELKMVKII